MKMKATIRLLLQLMLFLACCFATGQAKFVGNLKDDDEGGTITILDIQDDNKTQYLNQNFEQGNYNYGYDIKPSGPVGQFHHENKSPDNVVYGCYGYEAPDSKNHMTFYISDAWGYRPVRQEMDTEIFFPADNPGGGHKNGKMTRWADLVFPEMCAHFAERIASSTNLVTKAPIQVATPPASFIATSQPIPSSSTSLLSNNFGNKNTPAPAGGFDIVSVNSPNTLGTSSPFSRLTTNPAGPGEPIDSDSPPQQSANLPSVGQTSLPNPHSNVNVTPNRFSIPVGTATNNIPTTVTENRQPTVSNPRLRTTSLPSSQPTTLSQTQGSNVGSLRPTGSSSRAPLTGLTGTPTTFGNIQTEEPSSNKPTTQARPVSNTPVSNFGQTFSTRGPTIIGSGSTANTNAPLRESPNPTGPSGGTAGTVTPFGQQPTNSRFSTNRTPSPTSPTRSTTTRPFSALSTVGNNPREDTSHTGTQPSQTTANVPILSNLVQGQTSNSGIVSSPTPNGFTNGQLTDGPTSRNPNFSTQTPSRSPSSNRPSGNSYQSGDDEEDETPSRVPVSSHNPTSTGAHRTPTTTSFNRPISTNNPVSSARVTQTTNPALVGQSNPNTTQEPAATPTDTQTTASRRPTSVPSSSRFPTAGFSGHFNNPSTLQPSSTNQQNTVPGRGSSTTGNLSTPPFTGNPDAGRQNIATGQATATTAQRPSTRFSTAIPNNSNIPLIPQEPDFDNTLPHNEAPVTGRPATNPAFGSRFSNPTGAPSSSQAPLTSTIGLNPHTGNAFSNNSNPSKDNDLFCSTQCSSCRKESASSSPPPPTSDEEFLNIPGALLSQVPVIFYPDCSSNAYTRPAIVPYCPSSQPSQCNNNRPQRRSPSLTTSFPDASNFVGHDGPGVVRVVRKDISRVARKVRRGGHHTQRRILST